MTQDIVDCLASTLHVEVDATHVGALACEIVDEDGEVVFESSVISWRSNSDILSDLVDAIASHV